MIDVSKSNLAALFRVRVQKVQGSGHQAGRRLIEKSKARVKAAGGLETGSGRDV